MLLTVTTLSGCQAELLRSLGVSPGELREVQLPSGVAIAFVSLMTERESGVSVLIEAASATGGRREAASGRTPYPTSGDGHALFTALGAFEALFSTDGGGEVIPLQLTVPGLRCDGLWARRLFAPLGYEVTVRPTDEGGIGTLMVSGRTTVRDILRHACVLLPAFEGDLPGSIGTEELAELATRASEWLPGHPSLGLVLHRYTSPPPQPTRQSLAPLIEEDMADLDQDTLDADTAEAEADRAVGAEPARQAAVAGCLRSSGARRVALVGIGDGTLIHRLAGDPDVDLLTVADPSTEALARAAGYVSPDIIGQHVILLQSSPLYRDERLQGCDAFVLQEVIEHIWPERLQTLERRVFEVAASRTVIVTTPNADFAPKWPSQCTNGRRHADHRFEWGREAFRRWAHGVAMQMGYTAEVLPVGPEDPELGAPTLMGVFRRAD